MTVRIEALAFGSHYFAVIHRTGEHDEIVDGPDGKPMQFATATEAVCAGKRAAGMVEPDQRPTALAQDAKGWRRTRVDAAAAELARVFGEGRQRAREGQAAGFVVERKRRRRG